MLALLLHAQGIESVVLEARDREYVEQRVRAGLLEQNTVDLLRATRRRRAAGRARASSTTASTCASTARTHRIADDRADRPRTITIYGQQEVVKDLIAARLALRRRRCTSRSPTSPCTTSTATARASRYTRRRRARTSSSATSSPAATASTASAGRRSPTASLTTHDYEYPFGWLGILAEAAPATDELDLRLARRAASRCTRCAPPRSAASTSRSPTDEKLEDWPDERIWDELQMRLRHRGWRCNEGPIFDKGITPMRSFVASRCSTAACSWPATPRTSSRRPAPRASTWRSTTSRLLAAALGAHYGTGSRRGAATATATRACAASGARRTSPTT